MNCPTCHTPLSDDETLDMSPLDIDADDDADHLYQQLEDIDRIASSKASTTPPRAHSLTILDENSIGVIYMCSANVLKTWADLAGAQTDVAKLHEHGLTFTFDPSPSHTNGYVVALMPRRCRFNLSTPKD